jgi:hypothetical protein
LRIDAQTYCAKDEKRQRNCKKDNVPIHVILLLVILNEWSISAQPCSKVYDDSWSRIWFPGAGLLFFQADGN